MVKHDYFPSVVSWLSKVSGLLLMIMICLYSVWRSVSTWSSFDLAGKELAILEAVIILAVGFFGGRALLEGEEWKQWKRVEELRRNPGEASLYHIQPEVDERKRSLPVVLSTHLSPVIYLGFAIFWLTILGASLYLMGTLLDVTGSRGIFIVIWVILGGIIIGLTGVLMYERIEATLQGLFVQRGFKRHTIPWEQAKLFAVVRLMNPDSTPMQYELSSARALLRWGAKYPGHRLIRQRQEYEQLLRDLLSSIRIHTGLSLLDLR